MVIVKSGGNNLHYSPFHDYVFCVLGAGIQAEERGGFTPDFGADQAQAEPGGE